MLIHRIMYKKSVNLDDMIKLQCSAKLDNIEIFNISGKYIY